ncbi:MAG: extracellular solute-binding protein [Thiohalospira sp.]
MLTLRSLLAGALMVLGTAALAQTTVTFWTHTHPPMVDLNETLIAEYEAQNPDVDIEYQVIPNNQFFEQMIVALSTGTGPDVINMGNAQLTSDYIPRGLVAPIDLEAMGYEGMAELSAEYVPAGLDGATVDGTVYGRPSEFNTDLLIIYVPDLIENGYSADWAPATWTELGEVAGDLSEYNDADQQTHRGFDLLYLHASWYATQLQVFGSQTGCQFYNDEGTESTVNSPECVEAVRIWADMIYEYGAANPSLTSGESTVPVQDYISGGVSMTFIQPWGMELVRQGDEERWENSKIVPLPQVDPENPVTKVSGYYWAVNSDSEVKDEAWAFVDYLASHPGRWLEDVNFLQATADMDELPEAEDFPYADQWLEALEAGRFAQVYPHANETNENLRGALEAILLNGADIQDTLDELKQDLDRVLQ